MPLSNLSFSLCADSVLNNVELKVDPLKKGHIFRPCGDISAQVDEETCNPIKDYPKESDAWEMQTPDSSAARQEWVLRKFYSSYASPNPYPWTELGYTFDWARQENGGDQFVRRGQTEFVIPKGDVVEFVSSTPTLAYCAPE